MIIKMLKSLIGGLIEYLLWPIKAIIGLFKKKPVALDPMPEPIPIIPPDKDYESIYNNKYPKADILYDGRKVPWRQGRYNIDVRNFFNVYDSTVRELTESIILNKDIPDNSKALLCLCWVIDNVKYAYDLNPDGTITDYWNFPFETLLPRNFDSPQLYGDCEDNAILLANMMVIAGIPYWRVRLTVGDVDDGHGNAGGHAFVTYFDEPRKRWVLLDPVFYPNKLSIEQRKDYDQETYYKSVWFSWNLKYSFAQDTRMVSNMKNCNTL